MRAGFKIIDADRHVVEPADIWARYLEPCFRDRAPTLQPVASSEPFTDRVARLGPGGLLPRPHRLTLEGKPIFHNLSERAEIELALTTYRRGGREEPGTDPASQIRAMDAEGVDIAILLPTFGMYLDVPDPLLTRALCRAYNAWMRDFCRHDPRRLRPAGLIARHEPERMAEDLREIARLEWPAVVLRPNPVGGRTLGDPAYEPFWSACEEASIAVAVHEGTHAALPTAGADRFRSRFGQHACSHPLEQMMALLSLIEAGVLERHPGLRFVFLESGCGWLPYWLWRLDEVEYRHLRGEVADNVRMKPSEYFRRQCFVSVEPDEPLLPEIARHVGVGSLVFGTDFPHLDHEGDIVAQALALRPALSDEDLTRILWSNPSRLFRVAE